MLFSLSGQDAVKSSRTKDYRLARIVTNQDLLLGRGYGGSFSEDQGLMRTEIQVPTTSLAVSTASVRATEESRNWHVQHESSYQILKDGCF